LIEEHQLSTVNYPLSTAQNPDLLVYCCNKTPLTSTFPVTSSSQTYWLLVVGCLLLVVCYLLLVIGCWLFVVGYWLLVVCCWLFVVGCLLFVIGCWLFVIVCCCWLLVVCYRFLSSLFSDRRKLY